MPDGPSRDDLLRSHGLRSTAARRAVLDAFGDDLGAHLNAEELADRVQDRAPGLHRSTVYRTLEAFEEVGLVTHVHFGHGSATYHLAGRPHAHAACQRCGAVIEVPVEALTALADRLEADHGFELDAHHFALTGRCAGCRG